MVRVKQIIKKMLWDATVATAFFFIGVSIGITAAERQTIVSCTVEEQKLAVHQREQEISDQIEAKIELLTELRRKAGDLNLKIQSLEFDTQQTEEKLLLKRVELHNTQRALKAANMEYSAKVNHSLPKRF